MNLKIYRFPTLKKCTTGVRERIECAKEPSPSGGLRNMSVFMSNPIKANGLIVLRMLGEEFDRRGYDPTKLFKDYQYSNYLTIS